MKSASSQLVWASTAPGTRGIPSAAGCRQVSALAQCGALSSLRGFLGSGLLRLTFDRLWPLHGLEEEEALQEGEAAGPAVRGGCQTLKDNSCPSVPHGAQCQGLAKLLAKLPSRRVRICNAPVKAQATAQKRKRGADGRVVWSLCSPDRLRGVPTASALPDPCSGQAQSGSWGS